jgi:hypothetical protein
VVLYRPAADKHPEAAQGENLDGRNWSIGQVSLARVGRHRS